MSIIGTVESLWRYPVKSMRGQELDELFASYAGIYGDRLFAFESSAGRKGFPFFTGRDQRQMIRYRPRFRNPEKAARPVNLSEAEKSGRANPISADVSELMIDVETPDGKTFAIDDPALIDNLRAKYRRKSRAHVASFGQGHHRLSSAIDFCRANGNKTWRRNRHRCRQAALPRKRLCRSNDHRRFRRQ